MVNTATTSDVLLVGSQPAISLEPVLKRLDVIASMRPDWDSYGAKAPAARALASARHLAGAVAESFAPRVGEQALPVAVNPLADGGLQLEWRTSGWGLELDIDPRGSIGYLLERGERGEPTLEEADNVSWPGVMRLLDTLFDR